MSKRTRQPPNRSFPPADEAPRRPVRRSASNSSLGEATRPEPPAAPARLEAPLSSANALRRVEVPIPAGPAMKQGLKRSDSASSISSVGAKRGPGAAIESFDSLGADDDSEEDEEDKTENRKERNRRNARETRRRKKVYMASLCSELGALRSANEVRPPRFIPFRAPTPIESSTPHRHFTAAIKPCACA